MSTAVILWGCLIGMVFNISFAGRIEQPDWALALLLGAVLSGRTQWFWLAPVACLHDLIFHWSPFVTLPWLLLAPWLLLWSDAQIGQSLVPRVFSISVLILALWWWGWSVQACLLTLCLSTLLWYWMARFYAKSA